ncbi:MAG: aromatic amino acid transport family protein, partial [Syntrophothermus sp.]
MRGTRLSFWQATFLMVGAGVGAGIMAVPYLAERAGLPAMLAILLVALAANWLIHLMLAEICFRTGRELQVIELMGLYVFRGRAGVALLWVVFALLTVAFIANLAAYIAGEGEIITSLTGLTPRLAEALAYIASAGVVFFGL